MKLIGTILPTKDSLARGDAHADKMARQNERTGDKALVGCEKRMAGGECRWYKTDTLYAVVCRDGAIRWFEVRADGDYPVK